MRLQNVSMPKSNSSVPTLEGLLTRNSSSSVFQNYMPIPTKFLLTRETGTNKVEGYRYKNITNHFVMFFGKNSMNKMWY